MNTYKQIYDEGVQMLRGAGISESKLDGRLLLEYVCGTDMNYLLVHGEELVTPENEKRYMECINRRCAREPLAYITGSQEFMGLDFKVSSDVLIPNQDTETLVEEVLREICDGMEILDLCTGSGCIILSILNYTNDTRADATDISEAALSVANENAVLLKLNERIQFLKTDLFPEDEKKYDIIVSNPPYIKSDVIDTLEPEVKEYEPRLALDGETDGLVFYQRILKNVNRYLKRGGWLFVEIGYDQGDDVQALFNENGFKEVELVKDLCGNARVVKGCLY